MKRARRTEVRRALVSHRVLPSGGPNPLWLFRRYSVAGDYRRRIKPMDAVVDAGAGDHTVVAPSGVNACTGIQDARAVLLNEHVYIAASQIVVECLGLEGQISEERRTE